MVELVEDCHQLLFEGSIHEARQGEVDDIKDVSPVVTDVGHGAAVTAAATSDNLSLLPTLKAQMMNLGKKAVLAVPAAIGTDQQTRWINMTELGDGSRNISNKSL